MTRAHRRAHLTLWFILTPIVLAVLIVALRPRHAASPSSPALAPSTEAPR